MLGQTHTYTRNHTHLCSLTQKGRSEMRAKNCGPFLSRKKIHSLRVSHTSIVTYSPRAHVDLSIQMVQQTLHIKTNMQKVLKIDMEPN